MKIKEGYLLKEVAGSKVIMPVGEEVLSFNGMAELNDAGALLFERLQKGATEDELVKALLDTYEVDEATAARDVSSFVEKVKGAGMLE